MTSFQIRFDTDNEAFSDVQRGVEASRLLREVAYKIDNGQTEGKVRDINGNTVGAWRCDDE